MSACSTSRTVNVGFWIRKVGSADMKQVGATNRDF